MTLKSRLKMVKNLNPCWHVSFAAYFRIDFLSDVKTEQDGIFTNDSEFLVLTGYPS